MIKTEAINIIKNFDFSDNMLEATLSLKEKLNLIYITAKLNADKKNNPLQEAVNHARNLAIYMLKYMCTDYLEEWEIKEMLIEFYITTVNKMYKEMNYSLSKELQEFSLCTP